MSGVRINERKNEGVRVVGEFVDGSCKFGCLGGVCGVRIMAAWS